MSRYAIVKNNKVVNVMEYDGVSPFQCDGILVNISGKDCEIGYDYDGSAFIDPKAAEKAAAIEEGRRNAYTNQRRAEYPPIFDYIDAVVKNDQQQIQAYIDACLAVKTKYPKPAE